MMNDIRLVRLETRDMAQITIVVRCRRTSKWRIRLSMFLMRLAGKVGGFKRVKFVSEKTANPER